MGAGGREVESGPRSDLPGGGARFIDFACSAFSKLDQRAAEELIGDEVDEEIQRKNHRTFHKGGQSRYSRGHFPLLMRPNMGLDLDSRLAGQEGLEPPTTGFGDRLFTLHGLSSSAENRPLAGLMLTNDRCR